MVAVDYDADSDEVCVCRYCGEFYLAWEDQLLDGYCAECSSTVLPESDRDWKEPMLYQRIERLISEMAKHPEISAEITRDGITVQVTGDTVISRTFPLLKVAISNTNVLTAYLNDMRGEAGGLNPRDLIREDIYYLSAIKRRLDRYRLSATDGDIIDSEMSMLDLEALSDECDWLEYYMCRVKP